jgi:hypothetical protein
VPIGRRRPTPVITATLLMPFLLIS